MKKFKKTFMAVALLSMSVATAFAQATYTDAENKLDDQTTNDNDIKEDEEESQNN